MKIYTVAASQRFYEDLWLPIDTRLRFSARSGRGEIEIEIEFPCEKLCTPKMLSGIENGKGNDRAQNFSNSFGTKKVYLL